MELVGRYASSKLGTFVLWIWRPMLNLDLLLICRLIQSLFNFPQIKSARIKYRNQLIMIVTIRHKGSQLSSDIIIIFVCYIFLKAGKIKNKRIHISTLKLNKIITLITPSSVEVTTLASGKNL